MSTDDALMEDVVGWDVRTWSKAVRFWDGAVGAVGEPADFATPGSPRSPLECLEIGAGPGGPSLWLALKGHNVLCSNRSATEAMASPLHSRYPSKGRIEYRDIDATDIPYENHFDLVIFKSVLGGIGSDAGSRKAMAEILKALKPGGRLLFAENLRGTVVHRLARAVAYTLRRASWRFMTIAELKALLAGFERYELHTTGVLAMFGTTEAQRRALATADDRIVNRMVPASWRYVSYGVAAKASAAERPAAGA